jgi:hypothetical protein
MKKIAIKIAIVAVIVLVLGVVVSALFLGSIVKKGVETVGPALTKTELKLDGASLSILSGSGSIKGLFVGNPEGFKTPSAIKVGTVSLGVKPMSVLSDKVHVTHVRVEAPDITFETSLKANNLSKILANVEAATGGPSTNKTEPKAKGTSKKLQVDDFLVSGAKIHVSATMLGGKAMTLPLPDIHFTNLGEGPDGITVAELTKKVFGEVTAGTLKAVEKGMADLGKGALDATAQDALKGAPEGVKDATKSIGNLFKKK